MLDTKSFTSLVWTYFCYIRQLLPQHIANLCRVNNRWHSSSAESERLIPPLPDAEQISNSVFPPLSPPQPDLVADDHISETSVVIEKGICELTLNEYEQIFRGIVPAGFTTSDTQLLSVKFSIYMNRRESLTFPLHLQDIRSNLSELDGCMAEQPLFALHNRRVADDYHRPTKKHSSKYGRIAHSELKCTMFGDCDVAVLKVMSQKSLVDHFHSFIIGKQSINIRFTEPTTSVWFGWPIKMNCCSATSTIRSERPNGWQFLFLLFSGAVMSTTTQISNDLRSELSYITKVTFKQMK